MIKLEHVEKYFGDLHVLKDINLEVAEGEKLVIIGPSGSGKSTTTKQEKSEPVSDWRRVRIFRFLRVQQ